MKATALLEKQHRKLEALFEKLESRRSDPTAVLDELANHLVAHMQIENAIYYPAVRRLKEALVLEAYEEHALAEIALERLLATDASSTYFRARVTTLRELLAHHIDEEETELFPRADRAFGGAERRALGRQMKEAFDVAVGRGYRALLTPASMHTAADAARDEQPTAKRTTSATQAENGHAQGTQGAR